METYSCLRASAASRLTVDEAERFETREQALPGIRTRLAPWIPSGTPLSEELLADRREDAAGE